MKKCFIVTLLVISLLFLVGATKTLNFAWQQDAASLPNLAMWRIYTSTTPGGPYSLLTQIVYDGQAKAEYTGSATITQADNTTKTYYFICRSVGKNGNESGNSNEVSGIIDLTAPGVPVLFKLTISN